MKQSNKPVSPLRQRMIEDMTLRKLSLKTQATYIRAVVNLTRFLGRSPDTAEAEDLRRFQLHLVEQGISSISLNATITGLQFFFEFTADRPAVMKKMRRVHEPRKIPEVLSVEEVTRVLQNAGSLKYLAALSVAYGAGLRANEVVHRQAMLSPGLLTILRTWRRAGQAERKLLPGGWLFPGQDPVDPMSTRQLNRAFHLACATAQIDKRVSLHSLRHAFATHLLERHEDIRLIQVLLGHKKIENTTRYTHVAAKLLREVKGPLEYLNLDVLL